MSDKPSKLKIADREFTSRLLVGTGKFASNELMRDALDASGTEIVTVALRRADLSGKRRSVRQHSRFHRPETVPPAAEHQRRDERRGSRPPGAARRHRRLANWVKLEIHPDPRYLLPDPVETLAAAEILVKEGFTVLPYINADPVLAKRLQDVGTATVMPLGSPIGSNRGIETRAQIEIIIEQATVPVVVDAGLGAPSQAAEALEMGADAVLVNTAIAIASDPVRMAHAFRKAVEAGREAHEIGLAEARTTASATSPLTGFFFSTKRPRTVSVRFRGGATAVERNNADQGADLVEGGVRYRTWAPEEKVEVVILRDGRPGANISLGGRTGGYFSAIDPKGRAGDRYKYRFAGSEWPDPASRFNPDGVHGAAQVIDPNDYAWRDGGWSRRRFPS